MVWLRCWCRGEARVAALESRIVQKLTICSELPVRERQKVEVAAALSDIVLYEGRLLVKVKSKEVVWEDPKSRNTSKKYGRLSVYELNLDSLKCGSCIN